MNIIKGKGILDGKDIDIYIPELNLGFEYNGLYWHRESKGKDKNYHLNKTKIANSKNISLIQIFEDEWLYKKELVQNRISIIMNKDKRSIPNIKKCILTPIGFEEGDKFLIKNCIERLLDTNERSYYLGVYYNNELIFVIAGDIIDNIFTNVLYSDSPKYNTSNIFKSIINIMNKFTDGVEFIIDIRWKNNKGNIGYIIENGNLENIIKPYKWGYNISNDIREIFNKDEEMDIVWDCGYEIYTIKGVE